MIISENSYFRTNLGGMLTHLGYTQVIQAEHVDEASFFFSQFGDQIKLVLFENLGGNVTDLPISRLMIQRSELDFTPLVLITNFTAPIPYFTQGISPLSRIDAELDRPFTISQLSKCIYQAHERRAHLRNKILICGETYQNAIAEALLVKNRPMHWQEITSATQLDELDEALIHHPFRVGTIMVEPASVDKHMLDRLAHFKKTLPGAQTPLVILSRNSSKIQPFRLFADLFFEIEADADVLLEIVSKRIIFGREIRDFLIKFKQALKSNSSNSQRLLQIALKKDSVRWELLKSKAKLLEAEGKPEAALHYLFQAWRSQPCDPSIYLSLIELSTGSDHQKWISIAKEFCPHHPQIQQIGLHAHAQ